MSVNSVDTIIKRIQAASEDSPIAVFTSRNAIEGEFLTVFASTVRSQTMIRQQPERLVGVFHRGMDINQVYQHLLDYNFMESCVCTV